MGAGMCARLQLSRWAAMHPPHLMLSSQPKAFRTKHLDWVPLTGVGIARASGFVMGSSFMPPAREMRLGRYLRRSLRRMGTKPNKQRIGAGAMQAADTLSTRAAARQLAGTCKLTEGTCARSLARQCRRGPAYGSRSSQGGRARRVSTNRAVGKDQQCRLWRPTVNEARRAAFDGLPNACPPSRRERVPQRQ